MKTKADFQVDNHGSIFLLLPISEAANAWVDEHLPECTWFARSVVVEHRYIGDIVAGIQQDGLEVC